MNALMAELGDLPNHTRDLATEVFTQVLTDLDCDPHGATHLQDPGPLSPRDRILGYLEQLSPGLLDSHLGPQVERSLNALLLHTQAACLPGATPAR